MFSTQQERMSSEQKELDCFLQYKIQWGRWSVSHYRENAYEKAASSDKGDNTVISRKGPKPSLIEPVFGMFDGCNIGDEERWCSKQISTSQEGPFKRILLITRWSGINGQSVIPRLLGPITQLLLLRTSEEIPRVPLSAGLSRLRTWCRSLIAVESRI